MRGARTLCLVSALLLAASARAEALDVGRYRFDPGGKVKAARAVDVDGDGRRDLVLLLEPREGKVTQVLVLRSPAVPDAKAYFPPASVTRIACDGELATCGALALGRFGERGAFRLRFLGATGIVDVAPDGTRSPPGGRSAHATLFARAAGRPLALWEGVADLDGDGLDELWVPVPRDGGAMDVVGGTPAGDRRLDLALGSVAGTSPEALLRRSVHVPTLAPADLDGDGRPELVGLSDGSLVGWRVTAAADGSTLAPAVRLALPFLALPADMAPEEVRTPRLQVADVDGDRIADLLVTLVTGRRDQLGSLRTTLFFFPGPLQDAHGQLRQPEGRVDTESVVLHPRFVDIDGDGALDYVTDSIRGSRGDLIKRVLGADPRITLVGFRFDKSARRFAPEPAFAFERPYSADQALTNSFGQSAWLEGDLDGDGLHDLVDLGNLTGVEVLAAERRAAGGAGDALQFAATLVARIPVAKGLAPGAVVSDLNGDGRADVVLWNDEELYLLVSKGAR